jgi:hypothetical protein
MSRVDPEERETKMHRSGPASFAQPGGSPASLSTNYRKCIHLQFEILELKPRGIVIELLKLSIFEGTRNK